MNKNTLTRVSLSLAFLCLGLPLAASSSGKHLFILSGQSNMRQPLPETFSDCVEAVFGKENVLAVTEAHPSQPIKQWYKDWQPPAGMQDENPELNGTLYDKLMTRVRRTVKDTPLQSVTYVWMQGEADAKAAWGSVYETSFMGILDQLRADLGVKDVNFVVGRINDFWVDPQDYPHGELIREIQVKLGEAHANGAWVNTDDLNRGINPWGGFSLEDGHFPPPGYRVIGQRFAREACRLIDPKQKLDAEIFKEVFFDDAGDVGTHGGIGARVTSSQKPVSGTLQHLTDGQFGPAELTERTWVGFAPSDQPIELVVDLGEVRQVAMTGLHLLFSPRAQAEFPERMTISTSEDGENFAVSGSRYNSLHLYYGTRKALDQLEAPATPILLVTEQKHKKAPHGVQARYIKIEIQSPKHRFYLDEIIVNPVPQG